MLDDFLATPEHLLRGPYLSIALPFQQAPEGGEPFPELPLGFTPYRHQRTAMERLRPEAGRSTLIATGTGSGKTECFLYPILDHCRREAGKPGIKAIVIYPMNALATDQAGRIAKTIHRHPALRGRVTAGLFIGEDVKRPREAGMGEKHVIADRETLLDQPPDILLTNYRMLDYLLVRPSDQRLWRRNAPGALRYLVVDELHTFDGAQGTDLACLLRRLRARLGAAEDLICVGTSATLGGADDEPELLAYAKSIFHTGFDPNAIVGETRQGIDEFLGETLIVHGLAPRPDLAQTADPKRYSNPDDYLRAVHEVFFGFPAGEGTGNETGDGDWRLALPDRLASHSAFVNLLRKLEGQPKRLADMVALLRPSLPVEDDKEAHLVVNALCALISAARRREDSADGPSLRPFLRVGLHLWVRELRRMVCAVHPEEDARAADDPEPVTQSARYALRHSDDLGADNRALHLPLIQCRECHTTGWGAFWRRAEQKIESDLRTFYNRFFGWDPDVVFLFPVSGDPPAGVGGDFVTLCDACQRLGTGDETKRCGGCGADRLVRLFRPDTVETWHPRNGKPRDRLSRHCPFCGAREALIIFGARVASLLSVILGQTFGSSNNDDPKVIAFSDNVQDAAHRAGFIAARTWPNNLRAAIAQAVAANDGASLAELAGTDGGPGRVGRVVEHWTRPEVNPGAFGTERFIAEFLAPDRHWLRHFQTLQREGRLPSDSNLAELVAERLRWETLAELGYKSTIGRTLERTLVAGVGVDRARFEEAAATAFRRLREEFGSLRRIEETTVRALLLGILRRMRERGAIRSDLTERFLGRGAGLWWLNRQPALQDFGRRSARPVFPSDDASADGLEPLAGRSGQRRSWYRNWTEAMLRRPPLALAAQDAPDILRTALGALETAGLVLRLPVGSSETVRAWTLDPQHLPVTSRVAVLQGGASRPLVVPADEADLWRGLPCLDPASTATYDECQISPPPTWFGELYRRTGVRRVVAAEHTALLTREERERLQRRFAARNPHPWEPNLLSATPTLELGIDIGDLSTVALCSVPPAPENYVQRSGRAGRRDGNALTLAVATAKPHDLEFYEEPLDMLAGRVAPPGVFLNASAVLERQLTAFCFDRWAASGVGEAAVPRDLREVLDAVEKRKQDRFPFPFLDFVQREAEAMLEAFFAAFAGDHLDDESKEYLRGFLLGEELAGPPADAPGGSSGNPKDGGPLPYRLLARLELVLRERKSLRAEVKALGRRIQALGKQPADEASQAAAQELRRERGNLQAVLRKLNGRNTFNFLTDEGLLPNYAFPEEGITLKSVIYRKREPAPEASDDAADSGYEHETYEYVRPAASALSEFAPENEFYAGGRHVSISRIDLRVSKIETWRLCRTCPHCARVDTGDSHQSCPRCGDAMWPDAGQLREMLPLRLVHAFKEDRRSRIMDERDDREPLFYERQLVADIPREEVRRAFGLSRRDAAFGFEYVRKATFRDLNFGRFDDSAEPTSFAGRKRPRSGFRVCRGCGAVEPRRQEEKTPHALICPTQHGRGPAGIRGESGPGDTGNAAGEFADCLYLYREFSSEAIRMLLPFSDTSGSDRRVVSFVAALQLGLRRHFGGRVDHLRCQPHEYPAEGSGPQQGYLVLYDTVPGGTGYLKQLMHAPEYLVDVFEKAREALRECSCQQDPAKDGCHRCVFAGRRGRDMARTSRSAAIGVLDLILQRAGDLVEVEGLHQVRRTGLLESELETRFVAALGKMQVAGGPVQVRRDLVRGKPGYVLRTGDGKRTWYVEPQVEFGPSDGVRIPSCPDFVIRPARAEKGLPPVAVFTDGFEFHRDDTDDDSAKRLALVRAGYLVWSLTWRDLPDPEAVVFDGTADAFDPLAERADGGAMRPLQAALDARWGAGDLRARLRGSSFELLAAWLGDPDPTRWKRAVFTELFGAFDRERMQSEELRARFAAAAERELPGIVRDRLAEFPEAPFVAGSGPWAGDEARPLDLFLALPPSAVEQGQPDDITAVIHLHDDEPGQRAKGYPRFWNGALRLFNLLQFLPGGFWTTRRGVEGQRYPDLGPRLDPATPADPVDLFAPAPDETGEAGPDEATWREAVGLAAPELRPLLRAVAALGAPAPEAGFELAGESGVVVAEAEVAWPGRRVALLLPGAGEDHAPAFRRAGWKVLDAAEPEQAGMVAAALAGETGETEAKTGETT